MNYYAEAIKIITASDIDYRELIHKIAITNPGAIVRACRSAEKEAETAKARLDRELIKIMEENGKIAAIKFHRSMTKLGLKESKEYCENLWENRPL